MSFPFILPARCLPGADPHRLAELSPMAMACEAPRSATPAHSSRIPCPSRPAARAPVPIGARLQVDRCQSGSLHEGQCYRLLRIQYPSRSSAMIACGNVSPMIRLPPGLPMATITGALSFSTIVGAIEERGRFPGSTRFAIGTPRRGGCETKNPSARC